MAGEITAMDGGGSKANKFGPFGLFTLALGSIVGVSWIILVGDWIQDAGSVGASLSFVIGGTLILAVALCYAEIGSAFPSAGGEMVYALHAFGEPAAFATGWLLVLLYASLCAFEAVSVAWLVAALLPEVHGPRLYEVFGVGIHLGDLAVGGLATLAFAVVNLRGVQMAGRVQDAMTLALLAATLLFVAAAILKGDPANLRPYFTVDTRGFSGFLGLLAITPLFFAGFGAVTQALGEAEDRSARLLPRIMVGVILASILFYAGVILAVGMTMPAPAMSGFGLPAAEAFEVAFGSKWLADVVLIAGLLGLLTTWNAVLFAATRVLLAMGRTGMLPVWFARVGETGVPRNAVWAVTLLTLGFAAAGKATIAPILSVGGLAVATLFLLVPLAVLRLRARHTGYSPRWRCPGHWLVPLVAAAAAVVLILLGLIETASRGGIPPEVVTTLGWAGIGVLVWRTRTRGPTPGRVEAAQEAPLAAEMKP